MILTLSKDYLQETIDKIVGTHLRVQVADGDLYTNAVQCVKNAFDTAEAYTNRVISPSAVVIDITIDTTTMVELPTAPVTSVTKVVVNGSEVKGVEVISNAQRAVLVLPTVPEGETMHVVVEALVGYDEETLPGTIYQAVALMSGSFFEFTADTHEGSVSELPTSAKSLLSLYRIYPYGT